MSKETKQFTGEKLKELRKKHNLKQQEVADGLNVKRTKISEWETGRYKTISNAYQQLLKLFFDKYEK